MKYEKNVQDEDLCSFLRSAVYGGRSELIRALVEAKADVNIKDVNGYTLLYYILSYNMFDRLKKAVDVKDDIEIKNNDGKAALQLSRQINCKIINLITSYIGNSVVLPVRSDILQSSSQEAVVRCDSSKRQRDSDMSRVNKRPKLSC